MRENKIPSQRIYLIKGSRNLTRWKQRPKAVSPCQPCSNEFDKYCAYNNGNYGDGGKYTSFCACVKGIFSSNCSPLWDCRKGCEGCITGTC